MNNSGETSDIEILLDLETAANVNSNDRGEYSSTLNLEKFTPVGPIECVNLSDDSDEEITCLGMYSSPVLTGNNQTENVKEEKYTCVPQKTEINCTPGTEETNKFQHITPAPKDSSDFIKNISPRKPNVDSSSSVLVENSSGECLNKNIQNSKNVANHTSSPSQANLCITLSEHNLTSSCSKPISKTLPDNHKKTHPDPIHTVSSLPDLNTNSSTCSLLKVNNANISTPQEQTDLNQCVSNKCFSQENIISTRNENGDTSFNISTAPKLLRISNCNNNDNKSIILMPNQKLNGEQKLFGSDIKQQVRYVTLPAKFLSGKAEKLVTNDTSHVKKVFKLVQVTNKQPVKKSVSMANLPCTVGDKAQNPVVPSVVPDVKGPSNIVKVQDVGTSPAVTSKQVSGIQNNLKIVSKDKRNQLANQKCNNAISHPPKMLLLNNQIIKLKGIKQQECQKLEDSTHRPNSQLNNQPAVGVKPAKCDQCCQTENPKKIVVDQACQTYIYSLVYKNNNLYKFVNDGGKQVELVSVDTVKIAKRPVASPVSSLDNDSDTFSEDDVPETDEPSVSNSSMKRSPNNISSQTGHEELCSNISDVNQTKPYSPPPVNNPPVSEINQIQNFDPIPVSYQPENIFQEILYKELGLPVNNSASKPVESNQTESLGSQNNVFPNNSFMNNGNADINTVFNHELQKYMPFSQNVNKQQVCDEPAATFTEVQNPNPNTDSIVDVFSKLVEDIRTCLHVDALGNIPLHLAVIDRDFTKLRSQCVVLRNIGSNLNHINLAHETALMLAVKLAVDTNDYEAVSILVSEGADQSIADQEGNTPLHHAVRHGCDKVVRVLLGAEDADKVTEKFNYDGFTPLHIAAMQGHNDIITQLVGTNIDINVKDRKNGRTPYFLAVKEKKWNATELLKIFGAKINEPNFADQPPLPAAPSEKFILPKQNTERGVTGLSHMPKKNREIELSYAHATKSGKSVQSQPMTGVQSLISLGANGIGPNPQPEVFREEESRNNIIKVGDTSEMKELYDKYVKIAEKRKSESQLDDPLKPKSDSTKKTMLTVSGKKIRISSISQINNVTSSSMANKSFVYGNIQNNYPTQQYCSMPEKGVTSMEQQVNDKFLYGDNRTDEAIVNNDSVLHNKSILTERNTTPLEYSHQVILNNESVLHNKSILAELNTTTLEHSLNNNRFFHGDRLEPVALIINNKMEKSTSVDEKTRVLRLQPVEHKGNENVTSSENNQVNGVTLNYDKQGLNLENISEIPTIENYMLKNLPKTTQENCQSTEDFLNLEKGIGIPKSNKEIHGEANLPGNSISHSLQDQLTKNDPSTPMSKITLEEVSNELLKKNKFLKNSQDKSLSFGTVINLDGGKKNFPKQLIDPFSLSSSIENDQNSLSTTLNKISSENTSTEILNESQLCCEINEPCIPANSVTKGLPHQINYNSSNSEKEFVGTDLCTDILENKTDCGSSDEDSCIGETRFNIDRAIKDVIMGNKTSSVNLTPKSETESVQVSFNITFDDVVNKEKVKATSNQKTSPKQYKPQKRKHDESDGLTGTKNEKNISQTFNLTKAVPNEITDGNNYANSPTPKLVSSSQDNVVNKTLSADGCLSDVQPAKSGGRRKLLESNPESKKVKTKNGAEIFPQANTQSGGITLADKSTSVSGSEGISKPENPEAKRTLWNSVSVNCQKLSTNTAANDSRKLITDIRNRFSLVSLKKSKVQKSKIKNSSLTDSKSLVSVLKPSNTQGNKETPRKTSLDSEKQDSKATEEKNICNSDSQVRIRKVIDPTIVSRRSIRIAKNKS